MVVRSDPGERHRTNSLRVLVLERSALLREALSAALQEASDVEFAMSASTLDEAIEILRDNLPNVCLLGTTASGKNIASAAGRIRKEAPDCQVVILDEREDEEALIAGVEGGISAYLTKRAPLDRVLEVTRAVREGEVIIPGRMLRGLLDRLVAERLSHDVALRMLARLTKREREVLGLLAEGADNQNIAKQLFISPQTARTHIQNILQKLGMNSRLKAAAFVIENDLLPELRIIPR